jgi:putative GTP pyrophosphokinase
MTEEEFLKRWNDESPVYERWGKHVAAHLLETLKPIVAPVSTELFIRIPPAPRVKSGGSFLTKAFYNPKKNYDDPFEQITDKVGVRFVVLLVTHISKVQVAVEQCPVWTWSKDKDFESEIAENPASFDYQSVHYVVRCKDDLKLDDLIIPKNTPCEVQIRTLLQHAHSELTHDTIYKPSVEKTLEMERSVSKAMALIEATNDYFEQVSELIDNLVSPSRKLTEELTFLYKERVGIAAEPTKAEGLLIDAFGTNDPNVISDLKKFLDEKPFVAKRVAERAKSKMLFRQPSILLFYKVVHEKPNHAQTIWPLTPAELTPIATDLGVSLT